MPSYRAFGLRVHADCSLPALRAAALSDAPADLTIELAAAEDWPASSAHETDCRPGRSFAANGNGAQIVRSAAGDEEPPGFRVTRDEDGRYRFVYPDGIEFLVDADGGHVRGRWPAGMTLADTAEYLLGPVFALALRLRGTVCLHASAIAAGDGCFAVLAPAGHGKSTSAAAAARRGWPIVTEDLLALAPRDDGFWALPSYPRVRLWPAAVAGIFGNADALPRLTPANPTWDKRYIDLDQNGYRFAHEPLPLRAIYTHERRAHDEPAFEPLAPARALVALLANVYTRWRPNRSQRAHEFDVLRRLAAAVPVKRFRGPYGLEHVDANVTALRDDCLRTPRAANGRSNRVVSR